MTITIGERTLAISRPADLDAVLIERSGCNAAEHLAIVSKACMPYQMAMALQPWIAKKDTMTVPELAVVIAASDWEATREAIVGLLSDPAPAAVPEEGA